MAFQNTLLRPPSGVRPAITDCGRSAVAWSFASWALGWAPGALGLRHPWLRTVLEGHPLPFAPTSVDCQHHSDVSGNSASGL